MTGQALKQLAKQHNLTHKELAVLLNVPLNTLTEWLRPSVNRIPEKYIPYLSVLMVPSEVLFSMLKIRGFEITILMEK
jgi:transcriptional regulator with XRE-family HTH domain